jgi:squalene-hopene/tetraprenyl-beta-curcumene cyclase
VTATTGAGPAAVRAAAGVAVDRARVHLLELQDERGWWRSGATALVAADAQDILFREFTGSRTAELTAAAGRWIRSRQRADGGWAARGQGKADLSVSVLAYCALRLAGDSADDYHMAMAAGWIRDAGGLTRADVRTRIWLALFGEADWGQLRVPLPEVVYLPAACPVRFPGEPGWGRETIIALTVIGALRPVRRLPFTLAELRVPDSGGLARAPRRQGLTGPDRGAARAAALRRCGVWLIAAQQPDGGWPGGAPASLFSMIALHLLGDPAGDPVLVAGVKALEASATWSGPEGARIRRLKSGGPSLRATAQAVTALADAGLRADDPAMTAARGWLVPAEVGSRARWLRAERGLPSAPADSAATILAVARLTGRDSAGPRAQTLADAVRWIGGLQLSEGGWERYSHGPGALISRLPVLDSREGPRAASAEVTGQVLGTLAVVGQPGSRPVRRAVTWLLRRQHADGSWPDDEGRGDPLATSAALAGLVAAGVLPGKPPVSRAADWLVQRQSPDGGWSYGAGQAGYAGEPADSAPVPTASAVLALLAAGHGRDAAERGAAWLVAAQLPDGGWPESGRAARTGRSSRGQQARGADQLCSCAGWLQGLTMAVSALSRFLAVDAASTIPGQRRAVVEPALSQPDRLGPRVERRPPRPDDVSSAAG